WPRALLTRRCACGSRARAPRIMKNAAGPGASKRPPWPNATASGSPPPSTCASCSAATPTTPTCASDSSGRRRRCGHRRSRTGDPPAFRSRSGRDLHALPERDVTRDVLRRRQRRRVVPGRVGVHLAVHLDAVVTRRALPVALRVRAALLEVLSV